MPSNLEKQVNVNNPAKIMMKNPKPFSITPDSNHFLVAFQLMFMVPDGYKPSIFISTWNIVYINYICTLYHIPRYVHYHICTIAHAYIS